MNEQFSDNRIQDLEQQLFVVQQELQACKEYNLKISQELESYKISYRVIQEEFEDSQELISILIEKGKFGIWQWDIDNDNILINPHWIELLGLQGTHFDMKAWENLIHPDDKVRFKIALNTVVQNHAPYYEVEYRKKSKEDWRWVKTIGKASQKDQFGKITKIISLHQDITEKKQAEEARKISEDRNNTILSTMYEGVVIQDMNGSIISCNQRAEEILGLSYDQMIGRTSMDSRWRAIKEDGSDFPGEHHPVMQTIKTGKAQRNVLMGVHKPNDELTWISINSQLLHHPDNQEPYAAFATFHDITEIKKAEEIVEKEKALLQTIIDVIPINIYVKDIHSRKLLVNKAEREYMRSQSTNEILGKTNHELYPEAFADILLADDTQVFAGKTIINHEVVNTRHDGTQTWFLMSKFPIYDSDKHITGLIGISVDITDRKMKEMYIIQQNEELFATEEELKANLDELTLLKEDLEKQQKILQISEERYRQVVETQTDFVLLSNPDTSITFANEPLAKILGVTTQAMLGQKWLDFVPADDWEDILQKITKLSPSNPIFKTENRDRRANGEWGWTQWINQGIFDKNSQLVQIQSVGRDISQMKLMEKQLRFETTRFQDLVNSIDGIVWEVEHKTFLFTYVSDKAHRLLGYDLEEWYQPDFWKNHIHPDDQVWAINFCIASTNRLEPHEFEYRFLAKNGEEIWLRDIVTVVAENDKPKFLRGIMIDITAQKKNEAQLLIQKRRLNDILTGTNVGTWEWNVQSGETIFNERWANIIGYTLSELQPISIDTWAKFSHPDDLQISNEILNKHFMGELDYYACEVRMQHRDGHWVWVLDKGKVHDWTEDGKPLWMSGTHQDISKRKYHELELQKSETRFRNIIELSPVPYALNDAQQNIIYLNAAFINTFGYDLQDIPTLDKWWPLAYPNLEYREWVVENWQKNLEIAKQTHTGFEPIELCIRCKDGSDKIVLVSTGLLSDEFNENHLVILYDITERKNTEEALRTSERKFRKIIESSPLPYVLYKIQNKEFYFNPAFIQIFGYNISDFTDIENWWIKVYPDSNYRKWVINKTKTYFKKVKNKESGLEAIEVDVLCKDGSTKTALVEFNYLEEYSEEILIVTFYDITERKKAELALQEKEHFLRSITDNVPGLISYWDKDLLCKFANREYFRYFGYTSEQLYNMPIRKLLGDELFKKNEPYIQAVLEGKNQQFERDLITQQGETINNLAYYIADIVNGTVKGFFVLVNDITKIKKAQIIVQKSLESLNQAQSIAKIGSWEFDLKTFNLVWSREHYRIFELAETSEDKLYEAYRSKIHPDDLPRLDEIIETSIKKAERFTYEHRVMSNDGSIKYVVGIGEVSKDEQNQAIKIRGTVQDITERKIIEEKYKRNNQILEVSQSIAKLGGWELDLLSNKLYWTAETYRIHDTSPEEFNPTVDAGVGYFLPESKKQITEALNLAMTEGKGYDLYLETYTTKGRKIDVRTTCEVTLVNDKPVKLTGIFQDITEQKQAEQERTELLERFERIAANIPGIIYQYQYDLAGNQCFPFIKGQTQKIFACTSEAIQADPGLAFNLVHPDDIPPMLESRNISLQNLTPWRQEYRLILPNQEIRWVENNSTPQLLEDGSTMWYGYTADITERKKMEEQVKQLSMVAQRTSNIVLITNVQRQIIWANEAFTQITGYTLAEVVGKNPSLLQNEYTDKQTIQFLREKLNNKEPVRCEILNQGKSGNLYWLDVEVQPLWDNHHQHTGFMAIETDITDRKKAEQEKHDLLNRFEKIAANMPGVIYQYHFDLNGNHHFPFIKGQTQKIFAYSNEAILSDASLVDKYVHPDDVASLMESQRLAQQNLTPWHHEFRLLFPNQEIKWIESNSTPQLMEDGSSMWYGYTADITERKKMEEQVNQLSMVAQRTSNIVLITNSQRQIIWVNEAFTQITGYTLAEVVGKSPSLFQSEHTDKQTIQFLREKLNNKESVRCEILNQGKSGNLYWLDIEIQPLWDNHQRHAGFMAVETDITERKKSQQELNHLILITQKQNQRLREYAHITSHNMRSSVANMISLCELLNEGYDYATHLKMLESSVYKLDDTIRTMNDLLEIEEDTQTLEKTSINLLNAVNNNCMLIQNLIKDKVKLVVNIPENLEVKTISVYLDSILNNLLTNAIKYRRTEVESFIKISAWQELESVVLAVEDNGIGIDLEKYQNKLFKMKSRFNPKIEGKGVGLFFTKHQVETMGGKISVESTPNVGSIFKVWFKEEF